MKRTLAVLAVVWAAGCGGGGGTSSPTAPTNTPTRIISITGSLSYGTVVVGDVRTDGQFTINNTGNSTLTITGITGPCGSFFSVNWVSGTIPAGGSQVVSVRFAPTAVQNCTGTVTVNGDQTSGNNTIGVSVNIVAGYSKDLTGEWRGTIGFDTIITFTETNSALSGVFNAINMKGTVTGTVSNTGAVTFTVNVPGFQPFTFTGQADDAGNTMSGQVSGSGFSNSAASLKRVG